MVTKQTGCRGAGTHEPVRKLVRTERDGAGHAGAGAGGEVVKGLRPALSRPSGINLSSTRARVYSPEKSGEWCVKVLRSAGGDAGEV